MSTLRIQVDHSDERGFRLQLDTAIELSGVTALFGPSGSGKTSLLDLIAGLRPDIANATLRIDQTPWQDGALRAAAQDRAALKRASAAAPPEAEEGDDDEGDERARSLSAASASPFGPTFAVRRDLSEFSGRGSYGISRAASDDRGGDYTALN